MNCVICKEPIGPGQSYYTIGPKHFSCVIARAKDEDLLSVIRDGVTAAEQTRDRLGTPTPELDEWIRRAREAL